MNCPQHLTVVLASADHMRNCSDYHNGLALTIEEGIGFIWVGGSPFSNSGNVATGSLSGIFAEQPDADWWKGVTVCSRSYHRFRLIMYSE